MSLTGIVLNPPIEEHVIRMSVAPMNSLQFIGATSPLKCNSLVIDVNALNEIPNLSISDLLNTILVIEAHI